MTTISEALAEGTVTWKRGDGDTWELHGDDEVLGRIDGTRVTLEGRRLDLEHGRGYTAVVDTGRGSRLASMRIVRHGTGRVGQATLPDRRLRVSKVAVNPFRWRVTDGFGGPELLKVLRFGGRVRIRPGKGLTDETAERLAGDVVVLLVALVTIDELSEANVAASRATAA